ncbi:dihydrodipicolinate synthetase family protein-like protein [Xylariales sp. PMI_506]|nr:dihydrodipicolinate synthetase family protein-like protein [Xylariales sp. PMI_506]
MAPHNDASSGAAGYSNGYVRVILVPPPNFSHAEHAHQLPFSSSGERPLIPGVYVPTVCFFDSKTEEVDTAAIARHAVRLAKAGVTGLATQGSNGEAVHLTHAERQLVTSTTREALDAAGFARMPVIVGCGAQSTRETVEYCDEAHASGGDYALVLPPSYYATLFAPAAETVLEYFRAVADSSPIPLIIYNFPGAVGGLDLSSDVIIALAQHPNIAGVKLTCGNTGKLNRVAAATRRATKNYNPKAPRFLVLAGSADFTIQSLVAGGHGILAGLANIAPKACIQTVELYRRGEYEAAQVAQEYVAQGDWVAIQGGVIGVKAGLQSWMGYGGYARSPLPRPTAEQTATWKEGFRELVALEKSL